MFLLPPSPGLCLSSSPHDICSSRPLYLSINLSVITNDTRIQAEQHSRDLVCALPRPSRHSLNWRTRVKKLQDRRGAHQGRVPRAPHHAKIPLILSCLMSVHPVPRDRSGVMKHIYLVPPSKKRSIHGTFARVHGVGGGVSIKSEVIAITQNLHIVTFGVRSCHFVFVPQETGNNLYPVLRYF